MLSTKNIEKMRFLIVTFGCQMNKSDSERIHGLLLDLGMKPTEKEDEADLIILNTCSVRQTAENRIYGIVRNLAKLKKKKPHLLVAVTGCMAGRDKKNKMRDKLPGADLFFPISDLPRLPELIFSRWNLKTVGYLESYSKKMDYLGVKLKAKEWWRGWVVIQTGCSNYCTYCVVPYARGHEKNRSLHAILKEARELVNKGAKEINLLGQAVNGWQAPDPQNFSKNNPFKTVGVAKPHSDFAGLLWEVSQIEGINRIGIASAHPMYMTDEAIKTLKLPKMMSYLHLPVQSGNDEILKKMNRSYTREDYLKLISKIKKIRPGISLATDIIVGFPGETKKQFADTLALYKKCDFDLSYNAMYSPRTGTAAFRAFPDDVSQEEKRRRWHVLQNLMEKNVLRKNKKFFNKTVEVLVDGCTGGKCYGFSREYKRVVFRGDKSLVGQIVNVKITKVKEWELEGEMVVSRK